MPEAPVTAQPWVGGEWVLSDTAPGDPAPGWSGARTTGQLTASGRAALALCLRRLRARTVLAPAYGCPALGQGVAMAGAEPVYYPGDAQMRPQWSILPGFARRSGADTLLLVHPLGMLQDGSEARRIASVCRLLLVEDASHALANSAGCCCLGAGTTDGYVASLRKVLPVPSGGLWRLWDVPDTEQEGDPEGGGPPDGAEPFASARAEAFALPPGPARHRALSRAEGRLDAAARLARAAPDTRLALQRLHARPAADAAAWRARCRANWTELREGLHGTACRPVFTELPPGVCPAGFAIRSPDRTRLARFLLDRGIEAVQHWPIAPDARTALSRQERLLAGTVLTLPCDGRYGSAGMRRILQACLEFGGRT